MQRWKTVLEIQNYMQGARYYLDVFHTNVNSVVATEIIKYATKNDIHRSSEKG